MAANTQGICLSFKVEILAGIHNLNAGSGNSFKAALYFQNQGLGVQTTTYSATGEVGGTNYTAGGIAVPNATGILSSTPMVYWEPSASLTWTNLTISSPFDCVLLYNATQGNRAMAVFTFPAQTVSAATFSITMPANVSTSALIQLN